MALAHPTDESGERRSARPGPARRRALRAPQTASGGLRSIAYRHARRNTLQPHGASGKTRPRYDRAQRATLSPQNKQPSKNCTMARARAAAIGQQFGALSNQLKDLSIGAGLITGVAALGEGPTLGADTPFTAAGAATTGFFATGATVTGAASAGFNSYASGSAAPLLREALVDAASFSVGSILEKVPSVKDFSEAITGLGEKGLDALNEVKAACGGS